MSEAGLWPFPPGSIVTMPQEQIAAMKECRCGGFLRDSKGATPEGAWAFRQCETCRTVYVLRFMVVIEPLRVL